MTDPAKMDEILDLLSLNEVADALRFVEVMERGRHMSVAEVDEWRRRIVPCSRTLNAAYPTYPLRQG